MPLELPVLYPITDKSLSGRSSHFAILKELIRGGATWIQIRDKSTPTGELYIDLARCVEYAASRGVRIIVDDRCDLALSVRADGVHLGQQDLPPRPARRLLGARSILGYSTHNLRQIRSANLLPVDYVGFGPVFATATKTDPDPNVEISGLRRACALSRKPVVAIGGINSRNIPSILASGAAGAAVISDLMCAASIAHQMERLLRIARGTQ